MASGKKGKKTKGITLALNDFLQESVGSLPSQPIRKSTKSWADEIDDYDAVDPKTVNMVLPTAPKASRDFDDIASKVPKEPPFMAYLSNLPYDIDEDEITEFFKNLKISRMKIPKEERSGEVPKLRGYGYVEFEDRESLMSALIIPDTTLKNRRIRIEVAENAENDRRRGGRTGMGDRMTGSSDTGGDWRSTNRPEPIEDRRGGRGFSRDGGGSNFTREGMREGGRDGDYGGFNRDRDGGFNRDRDFGRDRDSGFNRDGGFNRNRDQDDRPGAWRDGDRDNRGFSRSNYRDSDRNREDRDDRRGNRDDRDDRRGNRDDRDDRRGNRDERDERRGGFRRYDDRDERNGGFTRSSNRGDRDDRDPEPSNSEPRQRPKLQLAPRTKPLEQSSARPEPAVPSASIFGSAKPVDTTERERQVEEKLLKQQEERLRESSKDRKDKSEDGGDKKDFERGRPRRDNRDGGDIHRDDEIKSRDRGPPSTDRRNASGEDNRRSANLRGDYKSPDKKKHEKQDRPKQEERRGKQDIEMPKFQEPEPPNFQGSNKFALLDDNSD